ncbi:MAG: hypothetical protein GXY74_00980 [Phycisphaerae bacterium]|nr:hypothetical protein [Phycisphaerae bacterium]
MAAPEDAGWPPNRPMWDGLATGTGEEKTVTFDFHGDGYELTAICGNTKTVTIDAMRPEFVSLHFISGEGGEAYHIHDRTDTWQRMPPYPANVNDPACFKMGCKTAVEVQFWHPTKTLTFATPVEVRGDVHWLDEYITGQDYGRDSASFQSGSSYMISGAGAAVYSEATTVPYIDYDHNTDISWRYQVKSPQGTDEWVDTGSSNNLVYYIILEQPRAPMTAPWVEVLEMATEWAQQETTQQGAAGKVTEAIYCSGLEYNTGEDTGQPGRPRYYDFSTGCFKLTDCLQEWGDASNVNCWDCAQMLSVFSNALGADLQMYYITSTAGFFYLNYIRPLGRGWTNDPFVAGGRDPFSCHWTGWPQIFDACLQVDNDLDPTCSPHSGVLPQNMAFDAGTPGAAFDDYRGRLVDPLDENAVSGTTQPPASVQ